MPDEEEVRQIREAGFRGYHGCPHLASAEGCPSAFLCSEAGHCRPGPGAKVLGLMANLEASVAAAKATRAARTETPAPAAVGELAPVRTVGDLLAIVESGFDEDDGAVLLFPDTDSGTSPVSSAWLRQQVGDR